MPRGESGHSSMARSSRNAFSSDWRRQYFAVVRPLTLVDGKMLASCPTQRPTAARFLAVVRSWAAVRGNIHARCVPGRLPVQVFRFMHPKRGFGQEKHPSLATYRRHASKMSWLWQDMRVMHPKSLANRLSGMHSAKILPERGPFRRTGPSNHTWGANLARESPLHGSLESRTAHESCHPAAVPNRPSAPQRRSSARKPTSPAPSQHPCAARWTRWVALTSPAPPQLQRRLRPTAPKRGPEAASARLPDPRSAVQEVAPHRLLGGRHR